MRALVLGIARKCDAEDQPFAASATHFLVKLVFAAPASFLSAAAASQVSLALGLAAAAVVPPMSLLHLVTKLVFAAPASFLSAACESQVETPASLLHFFRKLVLAAPA